MANKTVIGWGVVVVILIGIGIFSAVGGSGDYDEFATCITDAGAKMYGAFWCPHCIQQKQLFGRSFNGVEYIECSNQDRSQTAECNAAGIQSYPTWEFGDGTRVGGLMTLENLASKTGCTLE